MAVSLSPIPPASAAPNIDALHGTVQAQIAATNQQSSVLMRLTRAAVFLGVVQAIGTIVQVWLALKSLPASH